MAEPIPDGDGRWLLRVFINTHPVTGEVIRHRQQERFEADGIRRAKVKAREIEAKVRADLAAAHTDPTPTVAQAADEWWELWTRRGRSPTTRKGYRIILDNHIRTAPFAGRRVDEVRTGDIDRWYADLAVGPSTVRRIHAVLSQVFDQQVRDGRLQVNPAKLARKPESRQQAKQLVPVDDVLKVLEAAYRRAPIRAGLLAFAALTGLRRGELCGVRWSGLDLDNGSLTVEHNVVVARDNYVTHGDGKTLGGGLVLKGPKAHQVAVVALSARTVEIVAAQMDEQRALGAAMTEAEAEGREGPFLWSLTPPYRQPLHPDTASNWFTQAARDAGVKGASLHDLRHWKASQTLAVGGTLEDAREALRHRNLTTTTRYVHADRSKQKVLVELLPQLELPNGDSQ